MSLFQEVATASRGQKIIGVLSASQVWRQKGIEVRNVMKRQKLPVIAMFPGAAHSVPAPVNGYCPVSSANPNDTYIGTTCRVSSDCDNPPYCRVENYLTHFGEHVAVPRGCTC